VPQINDEVISYRREKLSKESVLVIEDETDILELVKFNLEKEGYRVDSVTTGEAALEKARSNPPHLMVLDLMLPGIDGLDVCRILKNDPKTQNIPILMLTARSEEADVVTGLEIGAEDYVTKPFSPRVLVARIRAVLRRKSSETVGKSESVKVNDIVIHPGRHEMLLKGKPVILTPTEFRILHLLARRPGWVFTRHQIIDGIGEGDPVVTDRSVDVQIVSIRKKLGAYGKLIETVRGVGYRMKE